MEMTPQARDDFVSVVYSGNHLDSGSGVTVPLDSRRTPQVGADLAHDSAEALPVSWWGFEFCALREFHFQLVR
jgi:hypothetical protein